MLDAAKELRFFKGFHGLREVVDLEGDTFPDTPVIPKQDFAVRPLTNVPIGLELGDRLKGFPCFLRELIWV